METHTYQNNVEIHVEGARLILQLVMREELTLRTSVFFNTFSHQDNQHVSVANGVNHTIVSARLMF